MVIHLDRCPVPIAHKRMASLLFSIVFAIPE